MPYKAQREAEVGDPLEALLDLATATRRFIPKLRTVVSFGELGGIVAGAGILIGLLVVSELGQIETWQAASLSGLALACLFISGLSFRSETFLDYFERRLDTIAKILRWNPTPVVPDDPDPAIRAL
jgi:hypothetical protein